MDREEATIIANLLSEVIKDAEGYSPQNDCGKYQAVAKLVADQHPDIVDPNTWTPIGEGATLVRFANEEFRGQYSLPPHPRVRDMNLDE